MTSPASSTLLESRLLPRSPGCFTYGAEQFAISRRINAWIASKVAEGCSVTVSVSCEAVCWDAHREDRSFGAIYCGSIDHSGETFRRG